jgi:hypothetical protein
MKASADVLTAHLAGEAVLLNLADKSYYRLNETAAFVWSEIEKGSDREVILARILETYDVEEEAAAKEVDAVLSDLISRKLVDTALTDSD